MTKVYFVHVYPQIPLLWSIIRLPIGKFLNFCEKNPNRPILFLVFPHCRPEKKVGINLSYGYSKPIRKKYKTNEKRISSIRHTSEEKNPKNHLKIAYFRKVVFLYGFWIFSSLVCRIELILVSLVLYFFLIGLDTHNLSLRQLFFWPYNREIKKIWPVGVFSHENHIVF